MGIRVRALTAVAILALVAGCSDIPDSAVPRSQDAKTPAPKAQFTGPRLTTATFAATVDRAQAAQKTMRV